MANKEMPSGLNEQKKHRKLEAAALLGAFALGTAGVIVAGNILENPEIATFAGIAILVGGIALYDRFRRRRST